VQEPQHRVVWRLPEGRRRRASKLHLSHSSAYVKIAYINPPSAFVRHGRRVSRVASGGFEPDIPTALSDEPDEIATTRRVALREERASRLVRPRRPL